MSTFPSYEMTQALWLTGLVERAIAGVELEDLVTLDLAAEKLEDTAHQWFSHGEEYKEQGQMLLSIAAFYRKTATTQPQ